MPGAFDRSTIWPFEDGTPGEFFYSRYGNPTINDFEQAVADLAAGHGATELRAAFLPTAKNAQVAQFFDGLGLERAAETPEGVTYLSRLADLSLEPPEHIETNVHH
jgi:hypothetical protein